MTQPPLIYSLLNTIMLALVADLAGLALRHTLSFKISSFKKIVLKVKKKKKHPVGEAGLFTLTIADWLSQGFGKH